VFAHAKKEINYTQYKTLKKRLFMDDELQGLTSLELRALLRQETRKFLSLLERDGAITELEVLRAKMRVIGDLLTEKEKQAGR
jgi:hypothetical protein